MKTSRHTSSFHLRPCHSKPQYAACVTHSVSLEKPSQGPSFAHARTRGSVLERGRPAGNRATPLLVTACVRAKTLQSCLTLCNPMDRILPGSSVHGILQARILKWVAMPFSRRSSRPRYGTHFSCVSCISRQFLQLLKLPGKPKQLYGAVNAYTIFTAI